MARIYGFSKVVVHMIFDVPENIVHENKIIDSRIFNMDETSLAAVQRLREHHSRKCRHYVVVISTCEGKQYNWCV
jgi:hypothetical protein